MLNYIVASLLIASSASLFTADIRPALPISEHASISQIRENGVFGFPQKDAKVLYNKPLLRFSVWNNGEYLFAQAVLWADDDNSLGKTEDNREIGDCSVIILDLDGDGKSTPNVDRKYSLNPWPALTGLHYQICLSAVSCTHLQHDSNGRGAIRYVETADGKIYRVDTCGIPMSEISRKIGDKIRLCYWGYSPKPALTVNSADYKIAGNNYYAHNIPSANFNEYEMAMGGEIDFSRIPDGRDDISLLPRKNVKMPEVGEVAPEISAKAWINLNTPLSLASLSGKVVLLEFWATWCGPCIRAIPHLNELQQKYRGRNFQLLSLVREEHELISRLLIKNNIEYPIGLESDSLDDYAITGFPHAFVIDKKGIIIWQGNSDSSEMDQAISTALSVAK